MVDGEILGANSWVMTLGNGFLPQVTITHGLGMVDDDDFDTFPS